MPETSSTTSAVLTTRALNRALLARQLLLERAELPALDAVRHLYALQAQSPNAPYVALWTRLRDFQPGQLADLMLDRSVVRIAAMRSTIHLLAAEDCLTVRPLVQPVLERGCRSAYRRFLQDADLAEIAAAGRALVDERPRTFAELGAALQVTWPDRDADALAQTVRAFVPLVQLPPRGIWGAGGLATHTSAEAWLGAPLDPAPSLEAMALRYLAALGPASVMDLQTWTGMTRLKPVLEMLRPRLVTFRDEAGRELFDLPEAPRPDPETPAPVRFLGEYDNTLLSHADRRRILADEHRYQVFSVNGIVRGTLLVDGFVAGTWRIDRGKTVSTLIVEPLTQIGNEHRPGIEEEGRKLANFIAPNEGYAVEFTMVNRDWGDYVPFKNASTKTSGDPVASQPTNS